MNRFLSNKVLSSAALLLPLIFIVKLAIAETNTNTKIETNTGNNEIKVENNSEVDSESTCDTSVKNYVKINGEVIVDEKSVEPCAVDTKVDVKVKNNEGTVKYKVNGEEKTINITPKQNETNKNKNSTADAKENADKDQDKEAAKTDANFVTKLVKTIENFFSKLASMFS